MVKNKTLETETSVTDFINSVTNEAKRIDIFRLVEIMEEQTGFPAKMWGPAIIGFGSYHYKYESGREGDMLLAGFSPRKAAITLYLAQDPQKKEELLQRLGKHKVGKGCTYIQRLSDINIDVLKEMITNAVDHTKTLYPNT
jgi:hypothetical protein